ncbi:MAG: ATP-binding protein, partial [Actinobacteria bacterium]|nr:ATP-binding protein [Actinomycetota bacterium]
RRAVTAQLLENQERFLREERAFLSEAPPTTNTDPSSTGNPGFSGSAAAPVAGFDPVLISLIRRAMPNLVAYDLAGVQPMNGPTGLIFAMRTKYDGQNGTEAFFNEPNSAFSAQNSSANLTQGDYTGGSDGGTSVGFGTTAQSGTNPSILNGGSANAYNVGQGFSTQALEALGDAAANDFREMSFSIEKLSVTAKSRALKAEYSLELAQDLKAIHGLDAEAELANILSTEILAEINREIIRTIYKVAEPGAQTNVATTGVFDLDVDSNGRWMVEKFKGLMFQLERDANAIAQRTRRGKGNIILCSADVASALAAAGQLDYTPALSANLTVDDTGNTFAGTLNGRFKVYIDPFAANLSADQYYVMGYKGTSPYDAGLFYCPYVPLQMVRAVGQDTFQPKIGFKTRYGMVANPFAEGTDVGAGRIAENTNRYYRRVKVTNLM